jgi:RNA polymerase sigma-32 factor
MKSKTKTVKSVKKKSIFKSKKAAKSPSLAINPEIVDDSAPAEEWLAPDGAQPDFNTLGLPHDPAVEKDFDDHSIESLVKQVHANTAKMEDSGLVPVDPVTRYLAEIRKYPLLTKEQEKQIATKYYETKDPTLAEILVTSNLRFVVKIATEYAKFGAKLIDLIQEGNVGLMHGVREFNPFKEVRLITYAVWWIRGYIQDYLMRQYSMVRIGTTATQRKLFYQLQKEREKLERLGFQPGIAQLSGRLNIPKDEVEEMAKRVFGRDVSMSQPVGDNDSDMTLGQLIESDPNNEMQTDDQLALKEELEKLNHTIEALKPKLNEKELYLLEYRLLSDEPLTLQDIGDKYGITREAVRQIEAKLIEKMRTIQRP